MIEKIVPKDHEEWLRIRTAGFGSSEVAMACGLSKYRSVRQYWQKKMLERNGGMEEIDSCTTYFGHLIEASVAEMFAEHADKTLIKSSKGDIIYRNDIRPYTQATPDYIYYHDKNAPKNEANKAILECKTTNLNLDDEKDDLVNVHGYRIVDNKETHKKEVVEDDMYVPVSWYCQVQYLMLCTGKSHAALAWIRLANREGGYAFIERDDSFIGEMLADLDKMWEYITQGQEPPITMAVDADEAEEDSQSVCYADSETELAIERINDIDVALKQLESEKKGLVDAIKVMMKESTMLMSDDGKRLCTYRRTNPSPRFSSESAKRLQIEHPEIYEKLLIQYAGTRVLRISKK